MLLERDESSGVTYVYVRFEDRVDVHKLASVDLVGGVPVEMTISVAEPEYRVTAGACTCEGYLYRQGCRHVRQVEEWNASE